MDHESTNVDSQAAFVHEMARRIRERAESMNVRPSDLADAIGVKRSAMTNYWSGKRPYPVETVTDIADKLNTNVDWVLRGGDAAPRSTSLVSADDADWVEVPEYDLRAITEQDLGRAIAHAPIRRDWLNLHFRATSSLWLTRLLSDYPAADLDEGALVICRDISTADLAEGNICLWTVQDKVVIGRFSVLPDTARGDAPAQPGRYLGGYLDPALGNVADLLIPPSRIGEDGPYRLIGRILGVMIRPV